MRVSDDWVKDYAAGKHLVYRDLALDLQEARAALAEFRRPSVSICTLCYRDYEHVHDKRKWIGVDFDHTLALDIDDRDDPYLLGEPIAPMVERVRGWLAEGYTVKILTARMCDISHTTGKTRSLKIMEDALKQWCVKHIGAELPCTSSKDGLMEVLWDDRAVQVVRGLGRPTNQHLTAERDALAAELATQIRRADGLSVRLTPALNEADRERLRADIAMVRVRELEALINTPHTNSFLDAVRLEAAHQRERWAADHDAGKTDADWFWLIGYLAGKALSKPEKLLHHIVTTAAACLNWHMARTVGNTMRPGIETKEQA